MKESFLHYKHRLLFLNFYLNVITKKVRFQFDFGYEVNYFTRRSVHISCDRYRCYQKSGLDYLKTIQLFKGCHFLNGPILFCMKLTEIR